MLDSIQMKKKSRLHCKASVVAASWSSNKTFGGTLWSTGSWTVSSHSERDCFAKATFWSLRMYFGCLRVGEAPSCNCRSLTWTSCFRSCKHFPHENPERDFPTRVESCTQPSVVALCMADGAMSFSVEMVAEVEHLPIQKPLMEEIVPKTEQIAINNCITSPRPIGEGGSHCTLRGRDQLASAEWTLVGGPSDKLQRTLADQTGASERRLCPVHFAQDSFWSLVNNERGSL